MEDARAKSAADDDAAMARTLVDVFPVVAPYHIVWAISASPDNQTIYFSLVMEEADIWLAKLDQ